MRAETPATGGIHGVGMRRDVGDVVDVRPTVDELIAQVQNLLVYKLAPPLHMRYELALSAALVALGVAYVMVA